MKVLVAIANFGLKNMKHLDRLIMEYRSMPYDVDIVVLSNIPKDFGVGIEVVVGLPTKNPWSLPFGHKTLFADRVDEYDLFIYSEDDTLLTEMNINAYLEVTESLPGNIIAGLMRYELDANGRKYCPDVFSHFHWFPESVQTINGLTFARFSNNHSACYILTRDQLKAAISSNGFLVSPHEGRYDLLCSAATDPYTQCGFTKVMCLSRFEEFLLHHLPNTYAGKIGLALDDVWAQIEALKEIEMGKRSSMQLYNTVKKVNSPDWNKNYYESANMEIMAAVQSNAKDVLSVGSGWGALEKTLKKNGYNVECIPLDCVISVALEVEGIRIYEPNFDLAIRNMKEKKYDCVILSEVLQHLENPSDFLVEIADILREGGILIVSAPNMNHVRTKYKKSINTVFDRSSDHFRNNGFHITTKLTIKDWFQKGGIHPTKFKYICEGRYKKYDDLTMGLFKGILGSKIICIGEKRGKGS